MLTLSEAQWRALPMTEVRNFVSANGISLGSFEPHFPT